MARNDPLGEDGERGVIVMVSSSAAFEGQVGQLSYAATKGAIRSMTLVLARDLAPNGIRAMSIAPSLFKTAMSDQLPPKALQALINNTEYPKRLGKANEFAMMVRQCIENPYLNGECIRLDGAVRMRAKM
jgi:NAD(P)-dependent dehydrogenase (short-subunit alcohol dehydrogenase family)